MASDKLIEVVNSYDYFVRTQGVNEKVIDAYIMAQMVAIQTENDPHYGYEIGKKARNAISEFLKKQTGGDFGKVEEYAQANKLTYDIIEKYYNTLLAEAPFMLDSYCLYIERDRLRKERFYEPRRKTLIRVVDKLQDLEDDKLDELFVHQPPRTGKCLALDELVLTPEGFTEMRNIKVGSKVISGRGTICNVTDVFPQGEKDVYRVTFTDGTSVECCKEHLWEVSNLSDRRCDRRKDHQRKRRVVQTQDMMGNLVQGKGKNAKLQYAIDFVEPVQFEKKNLLIHPYVLGALLGDGSFTRDVRFCNSEHDVCEKVSKLCDDDMRLMKSYPNKVDAYALTIKTGRKLRQYGLMGHRAEGKFIPKDYLLSDIEDRTALLQGLMDTDGCVDKNGYVLDYSTASKQLAEDILFLARSLGCRAVMNEADSHYVKNGETVECQKRFRLTINTNKRFVPVSSAKHLAKYDHSKKRVTTKYIEKIEYSRHTECQCISVDDESHLYVANGFNITHNTQIMTFGTAWHCAKNTHTSNLYCTYKEDAGGAFRDGTIEVWTDPIYRHRDVFPLARVVDTDARENTVDLERKKKYKSLSCKGLTSGLNGLYDASGWMVIDDILEGIQDVLSSEVLHRKQIIFDNNLMTRKKEKCKVIYNGTIWSLHDIYMNRLDFLQNNPAAAKIRWDVLKLPALNENDESNFDYEYGVGFSSEYYQTKRAKYEEDDDMASWYAQFQQEPIERDGAVFSPDKMNFYNGVLPKEEPVRICAACDVALGGLDFLACAVAYIYENGSVYIHDVVFDNSEKDITQPQVVEAIVNNNVGSAFFESNAGGEGYKDDVERKLKEKGIRINMTSKYAPINKRKEQRIWDKAPSIRSYYFRDVGSRSPEYRKFMTNLYSFTMNGSNKHDDAPDCLATLAMFIEGTWAMATVDVIDNPFRRR